MLEVGCRGYTGVSTQRLLKSLGIKGSKLKKALKALAEEAEGRQKGASGCGSGETSRRGESKVLRQGAVGKLSCCYSITLRRMLWYAVRPTLDSGRWTSLPCTVPWDSFNIHNNNNTGVRVWGEHDPSAGCRGRQGDVPVAAPPPRDVPGIMERNVSEGWPPADDPAACTMAPSEVRQAEMPSRCNYLCLHLDAVMIFSFES